MNVKAGATLGEYALTFGESVLALGSAFFFNRAVNCSLKRLKLKALPVTDLTCILVSASIVLSSLSFIEIKGVSFAANNCRFADFNHCSFRQSAFLV